MTSPNPTLDAVTDHYQGEEPIHEGRSRNALRLDPFLFAQPEIALNANATRWLRLGATLGYRTTSGVGRFGLDESDMNGIVAGGTIAFGWF